MPYKERRGASPQTKDMQSIMNFIQSSELYALKRAGRIMSGERHWTWTRPDGKPAVCDWVDDAVITKSENSAEAWVEFADKLSWREWLNDEHWDGRDWDEAERAELNEFVQHDPTWSTRKLDNLIGSNPEWNWERENPQTIDEAVEMVAKWLSDCETNWEEDSLIADVLGVDASTMTIKGWCGDVRIMTIEVSDNCQIGFDKFTAEQRLEIARRAANWWSGNVYQAK